MLNHSFTDEQNLQPEHITMSNFTTDAPLQTRRGIEVILLGSAKTGRHSGYLNAWIDLAKPPTKCFYNLIIKKERGSEEYLEAARVHKDNVEQYEAPEPAATYFEAALEQVPSIGQRMDSLAKLLARCQVDAKEEQIYSLLREKIVQATTKQMEKGPKALYTFINTDDLPNLEEDDEEVIPGANSDTTESLEDE